MSSSRDQIFSNIRHGLGRGELQGEALSNARERISAHRVSCIPARSQLPFEGQVALFKAMATEAVAELHELERIEQLPEQISAFMASEQLQQLVMASSPELTALQWPDSIDIQQRVAQAGDIVSLTSSFAGIAETGTLMLLSGSDSPTTLNFLPDIHMVLLRRSTIVGHYEAAWQKVRERGDAWPRSVNMITGPSRSADIEQKLQMGAHGPKRLVIFILND